jgi:xylulokinase
MAAALGLGAEPGDVVVSLGTSGVVSAVHGAPTADDAGLVTGFADATGRFLPLVCTLNAARVLTATAAMLGTDLDGLSALALAAAPGSGGLVLLPYLDGERTPVLPEATGTLTGMTRAGMTPQNTARAAVEGMLCGLGDGLDALRGLGVVPRRVLLVGGAARSAAVQRVAPEVLGVPVTVPAGAEHVALGAARQAAWVLAGGDEPPAWEPRGDVVVEVQDAAAGAAVRRTYAERRHFVHSV